MWNRIISLIYKEFLAIWRDKRSRAVLIIPPIIQLFIFAFAATLDVRDVPIGIVNRDNGGQSFELLQRFHGSPFFNRIVYLPSIEAVTPFIDNMRGAMVMIVDEQFSKNITTGRSADILFILDGRRSNTTQIILSYAATILDQFNQDYTATLRMKPQNTRLVVRNWFNPNLLYYWYNIPALSGILSMVIALTLTALSIARERELGTFDQLLVSPLTPLEMLIGKILPAIVIGMLEGAFIVAMGLLVYRVPFQGSFPLLFLSLFVFISSIVGAGFFISSLVQTQQQAILGTFIFMSPSILLSGFATPIENMPQWLQLITYAIPLRYYLIIAKGLFLKALPTHLVLENVWPMVILALISLTASLWFFRRGLG